MCEHFFVILVVFHGVLCVLPRHKVHLQYHNDLRGLIESLGGTTEFEALAV